MKRYEHFDQLEQSYLFSTIARKVQAYSQLHPEADIIRMGIGDVTQPLCPAVIQALHAAVDEMAQKDTFKGYGPEQGYPFLREAILGYYARFGVTLTEDEIFVSDGAKSDLGNALDLFGTDNRVLIPDPVYPVYVDTNVMAGRPITYMQATRENGFLPMPDSAVPADLIYLCSPNNPTGAAYNREQLRDWVEYANDQHAILLYDAAYESFIEDGDLPHSIYEIQGAKTCAIEFCSMSKTAGFTGLRCGYTIVPHALGKLNAMWLRRQTTKFNGVSYIVQRAAEAVFTEEGQQQVKAAIAYYKDNARVMAHALNDMGVWYTGGRNSPYLWMQCPDGMDSWAYFDELLERANVVGTPGSGFGSNGKGFFRLTAFGDAHKTVEAMERIRAL